MNVIFNHQEIVIPFEKKKELFMWDVDKSLFGIIMNKKQKPGG